MDTAQWPQDIGMMKQHTTMEEMVSNTTTTTCSSRLPTSTSASAAAAAASSMLEQQRKARPQKEQALNCPRCNSTNTKFCYYNNYSLTQPRYFCKTCRRYWTEGGSLRNVPVGGGSRKNKRSSSSTSSSLSPSQQQQQSSSASKKIVLQATDLTSPQHSSDKHLHQNPKIIQGQDLNLAYPIRHDYQHISEYVELPTLDQNNQNNNNPSPPTSTSSPLSALELLRNGMTSRGLSSFMPMPTDTNNSTVYSSAGFALQDFKQTLNFGLDGLGNGGYGTSLHNHQGNNNNINGSRLSFPFEDLKHVTTTTTTTTTTTNDHHHHQFEQNKGQGHHDPNGFWNGMLGGGTW